MDLGNGNGPNRGPVAPQLTKKLYCPEHRLETPYCGQFWPPALPGQPPLNVLCGACFLDGIETPLKIGMTLAGRGLYEVSPNIVDPPPAWQPPPPEGDAEGELLQGEGESSNVTEDESSDRGID